MNSRRAKLASIRTTTVFPNDFRRDSLAAQLQEEMGDHSKETLVALNRKVAVSGRIMRKRWPFLVIQDVSDRIQLYVDKKAFPVLDWDIGDIVSARGPVHKSSKGDLYVMMRSARLLTKSLRPLPDKFHSITDQERRYRQRYVDLIMNKDVREKFRVRACLIAAIRKFLTSLDFMEVETPMLQAIPGGATARPFVTSHNALDIKMYLRIAPELYLKRIVVGGLERVFEINRNFRNEGLSTRHNPEFTMLELYWAFADYRDLIVLTENMIRDVVSSVLGTTVLGQGLGDLAEPFEILTIREAVLKYGCELTAADLDSRASLAALLGRLDLDLDIKASWGSGRLLTKVFETVAEHRLLKPTFITEYPAEVSPLARRNDQNPSVTDRFELFVGGREIANGFSELNDAEEQAERFMTQLAQMDTVEYDADYIRALEYGMPPTAGEGIGIDRLVMILTNSKSIRDVLLFPTMRP